eukprot:m.424676 g.424676  ORF g.424676 m.424676 type:complete len:74 (-) comp48013_c0_seq1:736-957(-)
MWKTSKILTVATTATRLPSIAHRCGIQLGVFFGANSKINAERTTRKGNQATLALPPDPCARHNRRVLRFEANC